MQTRDVEGATALFFEFSADGDFDKMRTLVAPGAVIWRNMGDGDVTFDEEFPRMIRLREKVGAWSYRDVRRTVGTTSVCEQHTCVFHRPGKPEVLVEVAVVMNYDEDGRLVRLEEYLNAPDLAALRT